MSTFIEPSQDETVSLNRKVKERCLFWALIIATNPHYYHFVEHCGAFFGLKMENLAG